MIIDLPRFIATERPTWTELENFLDRMEQAPHRTLTFEEARRFHFLYQRVSADLGRIATFASEPQLRGYLESLTARAYAEIHESRTGQTRIRPWQWFSTSFPRAFRRHSGVFMLTVIITIVGVLFGGLAVAFDEESKEAILPDMFAAHLGDPAKRVAEEEKAKKDRL